MKHLRAILLLTIAILCYNSPAQNCINYGFETMSAGQYTAGNSVTGWSLTSANSDSYCITPSWTSGSNNFWLLQTPISNFPGMGLVQNSPLGGNIVAQLSDVSLGGLEVVRLSQTFAVGSSNSVFEFAFAGYWQLGGSGHNCCTDAGFKLFLYDCNSQLISCESIEIAPNCYPQGLGSVFNNGTAWWMNWQTRQINLTPYIGSCVTVEVISKPCSYSAGHRGATLFDARCGVQPFNTNTGGTLGGSVNYCNGSSNVNLIGPLGYATYSWVAPPGSPTISTSQATLSSITITNVIPSSVYTLNLKGYSGCQFTTTYTIQPTTISIVNTTTASSCIGGNTGGATVIANGSAGYNYTWTSASNNSVVSNNSVAINLAPGIYNINVSPSSGTCGAASTTVSINSAFIPEFKLNPYCTAIPQEAYFSIPGATNVQWYNGLTAISGSLGGTSSTYTATSLCSGCLFHATYTSSLGCHDSTTYYLFPIAPTGYLTWNYERPCVDSSNGKAFLYLQPSQYAIPGANSFSIWTAGTASPNFTFSLPNTSSNSLVATGVPAGTYSVNAFDGFCKYNYFFIMSPLLFDYTLTAPPSSTVCSGQNMTSYINFWYNIPEYTFSWTPSSYFISPNTATSVLFQPTIPPGPTSTIIFSTIVTPTVLYCPITKTFSVTVVNTPTPIINPIPSLCSNSSPFTLNITPPGGTLQAGPGNAVDPLTGVITPSLANIGLNTFTYSLSEFTCPVKSSTAGYYVNQTISAALNLSSIPLLCELNSPLNLMNFATNGGGNWSITAVPGFTPLQNNVFYPSGLPTNSYVLTYTTNSIPPGCTDSSTLLISLLNPPTPTISVVNAMCTNAMPVQMMASPIGGVWSGGPYISMMGEFVPSLASAGLNPVLYSVGNGTCSRSSQNNVQLEAFVSAAFAKTPGPFCKENTPVDLNGFVVNPGGQWIVDGVNLSGTIFDPGAFTTTTMTSIVYQTHSVPTTTLCPDVSTVMVEVRSLVSPIFENKFTKVCAPVELTLTAQEIQGAVGSWNVSDGSPSQNGFSITHFFEKAGTYTASFAYSDDIGCKSNAKTEQIVVHNTPKADFVFSDEIYSYDPRILITNNSFEPDSNSYSWLVDLSLTSSQKNPTLEFPSAGSYSVTLIAKSLFDCSSEITHLVNVKNDFAAFVPNSFSPNGDGLNDIFLPVFTKDALEAGTFYMEIFDRWGHSIFKSDDPELGWNGSFRNKGESVKTGTYVYLLSYKGSDGKSYEKTGDVTILK